MQKFGILKTIPVYGSTTHFIFPSRATKLADNNSCSAVRESVSQTFFNICQILLFVFCEAKIKVLLILNFYS